MPRFPISAAALILFPALAAHTQVVRLTDDRESVKLTRDSVDKASHDYALSIDAPGADSFSVFLDGTLVKILTAGASNPKLSYSLNDSDIHDKVLTLVKSGDPKPIAKVRFVAGNKGAGKPAGKGKKDEVCGMDDDCLTDSEDSPPSTAAHFVLRQYPDMLKVTPWGLRLKAEKGRNFRGSDYIHLFFDETGSSILTTVPPGISGKQYVAHIIYRKKKGEIEETTYAVNQTQGGFDDGLVLRGDLKSLNGFLTSASDSVPEPSLVWTEEVMLLGTSNRDVVFNIIRTEAKVDKRGVQRKVAKTLATHTIAMSKVYHGSFSVGLVNSFLRAPSFSLAPLPSDTSKRTVLKRDSGRRGVVAAMAVLYSSPIVWLENMAGADIPAHKLYGRSFLEDHDWYEKMFPCVGVQLNDAVFKNLFFGFDFEFARGGSVFAGAHYAKVNVFDGEFEYGKAAMTEAEFNTRLDSRWKVNLALGANLDISLVTNLFKK